MVVLHNCAVTLIRQMSEWGVRMIQGKFPLLKDTLLYEEMGERHIILQSMIYLYNFQTSKLQINQILNTYMESDNGFFGYDYITPNANNDFK